MTEQPLSARAYASAVRMHQGDTRMARPRPEDFAHLDAGPVAAPERDQPAAPEASPGWDSSAFDALPAESRDAVMAGTAHVLGRSMLELEADKELIRPADVHLHLTDPARYVDPAGRVDRAGIRRDVAQLVRDRPELARYGTRPGQSSARPDERRRAAPGTAHGGGRPVTVGAVEATLARMEAASGVKFR